MDKTLNFTQSRSGYVLFIDRAGNTGQIFLDLNIEATAAFTIITQPAFRQYAGEINGLSGLATTGDLWVAYKNDAGTWTFTHNAPID
jgi:hypothetical protein